MDAACLISAASIKSGHKDDVKGGANPPVTSEAVHSISVVLPAHNEEGNIEAVVQQALKVLPTVVDEFEILIVDDGSRDHTGQIADRLMASDQRVKSLHHARNRGYGKAWRTGIANANCEWIFFMDSDRQFDIAEIRKLIDVADSHDIVTGYRIHRQDPRYRFIIGSCFNVLVEALFRVHLRDIDCGFKMFRSALLKPMALESPGALINTEIHAKANLTRASLVEVGINHYPRSVGRQSGTKPKVILSAAVEIVRLRWHLRNYRPRIDVSGSDASKAYPETSPSEERC